MDRKDQLNAPNYFGLEIAGAPDYPKDLEMVGWVQFPLEEAQACIDNAYMVMCVRTKMRALQWISGFPSSDIKYIMKFLKPLLSGTFIFAPKPPGR